MQAMLHQCGLLHVLAFLTWFKMIFVNFAAEKLAKRHFWCVVDEVLYILDVNPLQKGEETSNSRSAVLLS